MANKRSDSGHGTSAALEALRAFGIEHTLVAHSDGVRSAADLARDLGVETKRIPKSILLKREDDAFVLCLLSPEKKVDLDAVSLAYNGQKMSIASRDEILAATGFELGTVSPFGLPQTIPVIVDRELLGFGTVYVGCGIARRDVIVRMADIVRFLEPVVLQISK